MSYSHQLSMRLFFTFVLFLYAQITEGICEFELPSSFVPFHGNQGLFDFERKKRSGSERKIKVSCTYTMNRFVKFNSSSSFPQHTLLRRGKKT